MEIKVIISADDSALEFARHLGKLTAEYISQSDVEAGIAGKLGKGLDVAVQIEPDTLPFEDEVEKGRVYAEQMKADTAKAEPEDMTIKVPAKVWTMEAVRELAKSKTTGKRFKEIVMEVSGGKTDKLTALSADLYGTLALRLEAE